MSSCRSRSCTETSSSARTTFSAPRPSTNSSLVGWPGRSWPAASGTRQAACARSAPNACASRLARTTPEPRLRALDLDRLDDAVGDRRGDRRAGGDVFRPYVGLLEEYGGRREDDFRRRAGERDRERRRADLIDRSDRRVGHEVALGERSLTRRHNTTEGLREDAHHAREQSLIGLLFRRDVDEEP